MIPLVLCCADESPMGNDQYAGIHPYVNTAARDRGDCATRTAGPEYVNTGPQTSGGTSRTPRSSPAHKISAGSLSVAIAVDDLSIADASGGLGEVGATYRAVCDYSTLQLSCLSFCQGDTAVLNEIQDQGWWKVTCNGQSGWVPASYWQKEVGVQFT